MLSRSRPRLLHFAPRFRRALSTRPPLEGDAYAILGAERGSSAKDLKKAYHRLARSWHPDVSSQPDAAFVFPHISRSYEILSDAQQRHLYDFILAKRLLPLATPDRFQAFYARASAYTPEELVHMFHRTVWRACAAAAAAGAAVIALRTRRVDGNSPAPRAAAFGGLVFGGCAATAITAGGTLGPAALLAISGVSVLAGRALFAAGEERLGRPRNFESHGARWLLANARPACELGGAAAAVYLTLRGRTPAAMFERHLRSLRAAVLGALTGHLGARLAVRPEDAIGSGRSD